MTQIKLRRDTAANFTSKNPILGVGEPAYETDMDRLRGFSRQSNIYPI